VCSSDLEDSDENARRIERDFKLVGLNAPIHRVRDAQEAIAYCRGEGKSADLDIFTPPDVIFLDINLPSEADGFALLEWIKSQPHLGRVGVVVTGMEDPQKIQRAFALGAHSHLSKGASIEEVWNMVRFLNGYGHVSQNLLQPEIKEA